MLTLTSPDYWLYHRHPLEFSYDCEAANGLPFFGPGQQGIVFLPVVIESRAECLMLSTPAVPLPPTVGVALLVFAIVAAPCVVDTSASRVSCLEKASRVMGSAPLLHAQHVHVDINRPQPTFAVDMTSHNSIHWLSISALYNMLMAQVRGP